MESNTRRKQETSDFKSINKHYAKLILFDIIMLMKKTFLFFIIFYANISFATGYQPLVSDLPFSSTGSAGGGLGSFLKQIFNWGIGIAVTLTILMIIFGGVQYMTTDAIFKKEEGKKRITGAVAGLLLSLSGWLILNQINPKILEETNLGLKPEEFSGSVDLPGENEGSSGNTPTTPGENVPYTPGDPSKIVGLAEYQQQGGYTGTDGSGRTGSITPEIAWMRDNIPSQFSGLKSSSTYRSPERNSAVGGSSTSDHLRGEAIDFSNSGSGNFQEDGRALVQYMLSNGQALGVDQIIFEDKNYLWRNGAWVTGSPVSGHDDHVHIGR